MRNGNGGGNGATQEARVRPQGSPGQMNFLDFDELAREIYTAIPADFRAGVDGLEVSRRIAPHPETPEVFTLGECRSEFYPSEFGGPGTVRSLLILYYGSFLELSRTDPDWDWDEELFETITHELRHHLEHLASEDELERLDYAEDQNFARQEGTAFDPFFYRSGIAAGEGAFRVGADLFVEQWLDRRTVEQGSIRLAWPGGGPAQIVIPDTLRDLNILAVPQLDLASGGRLHLVLLLRHSWRERFSRLLRRAELTWALGEAQIATD